VRRGEIWWYEEPNEEPRPWLIVTRDEAIDGLRKLLAVPTTRTIRGIATEVQITRSCAPRQDDRAPGSRLSPKFPGVMLRDLPLRLGFGR
jgi:hypothetical protein